MAGRKPFGNLRHNRVRNYMRKRYGSKAFVGGDPEHGDIKLKYLRIAKESTTNPSLKKAITLAINFRHFRHRK